MSSGLLAFAAGMGTGYLNQQQRNRDQVRQDKQDAWTEKEQGRQEQAWGREDKLQRGLASATNKAEVNENGAIISLADGTKTVYDDADVAGSDFRMLRRADEATGRQTLASADYKGSPSTPQPTEGVQPAPTGLASMLSTGAPTAPVSADAAPPAAGLADFKVPMAPQRTATMNGKAFGSLAEAQAAGKAYDTPEALTARQAAAYRAAGQPEKAMQLESGAKQGKLADFQLDKATTEHMNDLANQEIYKKITANGGNAVATMAQLITKTNMGGLEGSTAEVKITPDGKYQQIVVTAPDGTTKVAKQYDNNNIGQMRAHQDLMTGDPMVKIKWLHDNHLQDQKDKVDAAGINKDNAQANYYGQHALQVGALAANGGVAEKPPAGYRKTMAGNLEAIPGGPADLKLQGAFNGDTAALTGSVSSFDRLASAANEVLNHPGLDGITGWRGKIPNIPGSDAANAEALLGTLKSQVGFGVLQDMRNNSKTGGALGSVSDAEGKRLEANLAALDKAQSPEQYRAQLKKIVEYSEQAKGRLRESFNLRHPADGQQRAGQAGQSQGARGQIAGKGAPALAMPKTASALQAGGIYQTSRGPAKWNGTAFEAQ